MRFATIAALFATGALAAPAIVARDVVSETVEITDLSVRKSSDGTLVNVNFKLSGGEANDALCTLDSPVLPYSEITKCSTPEYLFALVNGKDTEFGVRIYKSLGGPAGLYGDADVFAYCHAGGNGDLLCTQQNPVSVVIDNV